jgi:hypothetical protein
VRCLVCKDPLGFSGLQANGQGPKSDQVLREHGVGGAQLEIDPQTASKIEVFQHKEGFIVEVGKPAQRK